MSSIAANPPIDLAWSKALTHPVRVRILLQLLERELSSPVDLAESFGLRLSVVSHHVRRLRDLRLIRLAKQTQRRGAVQHHYRLADPEATAHALWRIGVAAPPPGVPAHRRRAPDSDAWARLRHAVAELRCIRERRQISQQTLALRIGIEPSQLGRIERGEVDPRLTVLLALADELETSFSDVFAAAERGQRGCDDGLGAGRLR
jgi:DNA-binding XRE family transcriptional regulator